MISQFINLVYIMKGQYIYIYICTVSKSAPALIVLSDSELGSIVLNAPDLDNTSSLYDLRDFTLLLPPGITLLNIGHLQRLSLGQMPKLSICVVYTLEKQYSVSCNSYLYNCLYKFLT